LKLEKRQNLLEIVNRLSICPFH